VPPNSWAFARRGAACVAVAAALAGCSSTGTSSSASSVIAKGTTLDIYLSEPPQPTAVQLDIVDAEQLAFQQDKAAAEHAYQLAAIVVHKPELSDNARTAIQDKSAIAYLGELAPADSEQTAGITNALDLLTVSPADTALELTEATPAIANTPNGYYESLSTYGHTFARVVPTSGQEATFDAHAIAAAGGPLYIANDGSDYGLALAHAMSIAAAADKLTVTSNASSAKAIFYAGVSPSAAVQRFNSWATAVPAAKLFGSSALDSAAFTDALSATARARTQISVPGFEPSALDAAGLQFRKDFDAAYHHEPSTEAIFGYAAMAAVLDVIKKAGTNADDRKTVIEDFLSLKQLNSVLGPYSISKNGNTSLSSFVMLAPSRG
jgi:ABC-type branched-subunit amino acid transport system substrate-binding protein